MRWLPPQGTGLRSTASRPHLVIPGEAAAATGNRAAQSSPARPEVPTAATGRGGCSATENLFDALERRILVLDGAMGTMIQRSEVAFEGPADALSLTHPEVIAGIHAAYLTAGADIVSTNSFNANAVSLADFGTASQAYEINLAAARIARQQADEFTSRNPSKPRFVAGSMGPTNRTASIAANPDDPAFREISFLELVAAYREQARGLVDGGVDILLVETVFDTLNAKAALFAIAGLAQEFSGGARLLAVGEKRLQVPPVMVSGTIAGASGRTLSGQTVEAFCASVGGCGGAHGDPTESSGRDEVLGNGAETAPALGGGENGLVGSAVSFGRDEVLGNGAETALGKLSGTSETTLRGAHGEFSGGARLLSVGLNCAFGAEQMLPYLARLADAAECLVSAHPNAGLPNLAGGYDETAAGFAAHCEEFMRRGLVNIVGGCCGTTPEHTLLLSRAAARYEPRKRPTACHETVLAGLETLRIGEPVLAGLETLTVGQDAAPADLAPHHVERESLPNSSVHATTTPTDPGIPPVDDAPAGSFAHPKFTFVKIGERANVAGSARFARLIREGALDEAIGVARAQIAAGAQLVDVCMDAPMIDAGGWMRRFLLAAAAEPDLARVPWMVDSSSFEVLESGLQCTQGKALANSISLKEGEAEFLRRAELVRRYGAAAVVMLFDEGGQADSYERKVKVAHRAYNLLTVNGFPAEDIVFDPNVLTIATGIAEHDRYAVDFIEATRWIKQNLPHARVSAGVSNLSFAFRGNAAVREAMHTVFLHHAVAAGLDMAIVNVATLLTINELDPELRALVEDVVLARRADATERLTDWAAAILPPRPSQGGEFATSRAQSSSLELPRRGSKSRREIPRSPVPSGGSQMTVSQRITNAFLCGDDRNIAADTLAALDELKDPMAVIDRVLMPAMAEVGRLFGEGRMFLSQMVKSARSMRRAVDALAPYIKERAVIDGRAKFLLATVKGDVHDIGKNIVGVVAACNGWEIVDLGVMVEPARIADEAERNSVSIIGLSGLITPSLHEMIETVRELERRGLRIPVLIGGATTSPLHTAVRIAPEYGGLVVHSRDASDGAAILSKLQSADSQAFTASVRAEQEAERQKYFAQSVISNEAQSADEGSQKRSLDRLKTATPTTPERLSRKISELRDKIDWPMYLAAWGVRRETDEGRRLLAEAEAMLDRLESEQVLDIQGVTGTFAARTEGDDIIVTRPAATPANPAQASAATPASSSRASASSSQATAADREVRLPMLRAADTQLSVAQWVGGSVGHIGSVGHTGSVGLFAITAGVGLQEFTDRLRAEGDEYSAIVAKLLADRLTEAFAHTLPLAGLRLAFGYPAVPDHSLKREVFDLLGVRERTKMTLTESFMIVPGEALCGIVIDHPEARYFRIGRLSEAQIDDYARRRGMPIEEVKRLIDNELR